MKSDTTASSGTPPPAIRMPVCPVAAKVASMPRRFISASSTSELYILPIEQSLPTVSSRRPVRRLPLPIG